MKRLHMQYIQTETHVYSSTNAHIEEKRGEKGQKQDALTRTHTRELMPIHDEDVTNEI